MDFEAPVDAWYVWMGVAVVSLSIAGVALSLPTTAPPDANAAANTVDSVGSKPYTASATYEHDADQYWASNETILLRNDGGTTRATIRFGLMAPAWPKDDLRDVVWANGLEMDELEGGAGMDVDQLNDELASLRNERRQLDARMSKLQDIIQFNEEMLDGTAGDIASALRDDGDEEAVTDQLLDDADSVVCWTCGSEVERERIEDTIERLREFRQSKYGDKQHLEENIDDLKGTISTHESQQERRADVERRIEQVTAEIDRRESRLDDLETEREDLTSRLEELETEIEELEAEDRSEVLTLHREVNQLEIELDRLEGDRDDLEEQVADLESKVDELDRLRRQKENINEQLAEVRTRVEQLETEVIEAFNHHMETILDILNYENLERIWVDRVERDTREGREKVSKAEFRLHIVRNTAGGVTYEDEFEHLSESEREVTGLVFALAGYLAHDVHEAVPFVLLDSLEAIDGDRIAKLVEYFSDYADYLVVALLQEDAQKLPDKHDRVTEI